jgi:hypothetical protein
MSKIKKVTIDLSKGEYIVVHVKHSKFAKEEIFKASIHFDECSMELSKNGLIVNGVSFKLIK